MYLADVAHHQSIGDRLRRRIQRRGVNCKGDKLWTDAEDDICRKRHPDYAAMMKALPHRTLPALKFRCRALGICKAKPAWTAKRDTQFRKLYRTATTRELREAFPEMDQEALYRRGSHFKLSRPRKPYARTGIDLLDSLRQQCWQQNITMVELDEFAKAKRYFTGKGWRGERGRVNYNHIVRAIHELGGTLSVSWETAR